MANQVKVLFQGRTRGGQAAAINAAVHFLSDGDILCFLDADDWWAPGKLSATAALSARILRYRLSTTAFSQRWPTAPRRSSRSLATLFGRFVAAA